MKSPPPPSRDGRPSARRRIDALARAVAEGHRVDWSAALDSALTESERCVIGQLRVVDAVAHGTADARRVSRRRARRPSPWSLVLSAGGTSSPESREALASLFRRYWYPVYAEVRAAAPDAETARDLTRGFFLQLFEREVLAVAPPDRGKFRDFVETSVRDYLADQAARQQALERRDEATILAIDFVSAERRYAFESARDRTSDRTFDRRWAHALLEQALKRLRESMVRAGNLEQFERLEPLLAREDGTPSGEDLAIRWKTTEPVIQSAVQRMRRRLGKLLRREAADTLADPEQGKDEIRFLLGAIEPRDAT